MGEKHTARAGRRFRKLAMAGGVAATATAMTVGLAAPSADAAATLTDDAYQLVDASGHVDPAAVAAALVDVLEAYAKGKPPTRFPTELTSLLPGLEQVGPALLSALGSQENVDFLKSQNFGSLLDALGLEIPGIGDILTIPGTVPGTDITLPVKVITTGPPFGALGLLGLNPFWVPAFPDAIAREINSTPYASIDTSITVPPTPVTNPYYQQMRDAAYNTAYDGAYQVTYQTVYSATYAGAYNTAYNSIGCRFLGSRRAACADGIAKPIATTAATAAANTAARAAGDFAASLVPQTITVGATVPLGVPNLRIPTVVAFGLGSLATGMAYPQVVADLANQPGGTAAGAPTGSSLTILPMVLLRNPGRANGGLAARFAPYLALIGLNTVTPDVDVTTSGGAVLVPLKVDATVEYDPLSDFPSWPNPFALANSAAALAFPTYILRGTSIDVTDLGGTLTPLLEPVLNGVAGNVLSAVIGDGKTVDVTTTVLGQNITFPLTLNRATLLTLAGALAPGLHIPAEGYEALNDYLTIRSDALPLLEPFRLPVDVLNIATGQNLSNPFADAVEPALKILVNLGYTDVDQSSPTYDRTLDQAGVGANTGGVPFGTLPTNVDWGQVPEDVIDALVAGFRDEFFSGGVPGVNDPAAPQPNAIAALLTALGLPTTPQGLGDLTGMLRNLPGLDDVVGSTLGTLPAVDSLPSQDNTLHTLTLPAQPAAPLQRSAPVTARNVAETSSASTQTSAATPAPAPSSANEKSAVARRPVRNAAKGTGEPSVGVVGKTRARDAVSGVQKRLRDEVTGVRTAAGTVSDGVKATIGGGDHASAADASRSTSTD